jgi:hypothetical protein
MARWPKQHITAVRTAGDFGVLIGDLDRRLIDCTRT